MTQVFIKRPGNGGICLRCSHDLEARRDGLLWCTNKECWHHKHEPHGSGSAPNVPPGVEGADWGGL